MKDIIIISYGVKEYDGRLNEIINSVSINFDVKVICLTHRKSMEDKNVNYIVINGRKYLGISLYLEFLFKSLFNIFRLGYNKRTRIIFIDNFYAAPIGIISKLLFRNTIVIQDCRELYFKEDMPKFGKIFCFFEELLMKRSELVFCANEERSKLMKKHFKLSYYPEVYDNIRFLTYKKKSNIKNLENKYQNDFHYKWNIINSGGYSILRRTDILIKKFKQLENKDIGLYIVGSGKKEDKKQIDELMRKYDIQNVHFIGQVEMDELKYVINKCQIGIVSYHQNDLNNEYCSSGKIYEYLGEGIPVVTTENYPLRVICNKYKIGFSDNEFISGIENTIEKYDQLKINVNKFMNNFSVRDNNIKMSEKIKEVIEN